MIDDDVPSGIDLREQGDARTWAAEADVKRPWRTQVRASIAALLEASVPPVRRVLELGSGPGLLAEEILRRCSLDSYVLFDFSPPMLEMSRERLRDRAVVTFVLGDFKTPGWQRAIASVDAVVTMQAVHEIRHKRHVPQLYREVHEVVRPGGVVLICDHTPPDDGARMTSLHSTEAEQYAALTAARFVAIGTALSLNGLYVISARREG